MDSIWKNDVKMPQFLPLEGDLTTDVLVVGGGLAGVIGFQAAYEAVHAHLQAHCHCVGIHEGHTEHQTPQHRGGHTHGYPPWGTAHHAANHNREVHEAQHLIHLGIMGGQQGQQKAAGQTDRCKGELLIV